MKKIEKISFGVCDYYLKLFAGKIDYDKNNII